jgi:pyocin large subunit-like protein
MQVGRRGAAAAAAWSAAAALGLVAVSLGGCGERTSAVETRDRAEVAAGPAAASGEDRSAAATSAPAMTASRRESAEAKIDRLYRENGADFGARSPEDFAAKARAFIDQPPAGTERVERPNGDVLLYQASTNTFAVASRDGAPRTLFKPRDGAAYWAEQKAAAPTFGRRRPSSSE